MSLLDLTGNPIVMFFIVVAMIAHIVALCLSFTIVGLFFWSFFQRDRWWTLKTWIVTAAAVAYLGVSFLLMR